MAVYRHLLAIAIAHFVLAAPGSVRAQGSRASDKDLQDLREFLDAEVKIIKKKDEDVSTKLAALRELDQVVNQTVQSANSNDRDSIAPAAIALVQYERAIQYMDQSARDLGLQLQRSDNTFKLVKQKEGDGVIPKGTLTLEHEKVQDHAKVNLDKAKEVLAKAPGEAAKLTKTLEPLGVRPASPVVGLGGPAGLVVVYHWLPKEIEQGRTANGFVVIANYDARESHSGKLSIRAEGGKASLDKTDVTLGPGAAEKVNITVTINPGETGVRVFGTIEQKK